MAVLPIAYGKKMKLRRVAPGADEYIDGLSERLAIARKLVEPVQAEAARQCGVEPRTWHRWELGLRTIDPFALARFCVEYDIDPRFLLLGDPTGLRWPLGKNLALIPEGRKYAPDERPAPVPPVFPENRPAAATGTSRRRQLARLS